MKRITIYVDERSQCKHITILILEEKENADAHCAKQTLTWRSYTGWYWRIIITPSFDIAAACSKKVAAAMCQIGYWTHWSHRILETVPFIAFTFADNVSKIRPWRPLNCKSFPNKLLENELSQCIWFDFFSSSPLFLALWVSVEYNWIASVRSYIRMLLNGCMV